MQRIARGEVDVNAELAGAAAEEKQKLATQSAAARWTTATQWALALSLTASQKEMEVRVGGWGGGLGPGGHHVGLQTWRQLVLAISVCQVADD